MNLFIFFYYSLSDIKPKVTSTLLPPPPPAPSLRIQLSYFILKWFIEAGYKNVVHILIRSSSSSCSNGGRHSTEASLADVCTDISSFNSRCSRRKISGNNLNILFS